MADEKEEVESPQITFEPIVTLSPIETKTLEEDEDEIFKVRAKLFRYDSVCEPAQWKERGTGDIKITKHKSKNRCRILMRRDKTLKMCANHFLLSEMELKPNCGSDRAWVWRTDADYADEEARPELLAVRFANADNAQKFKEKFDECRERLKESDTVDNEKEDDIKNDADDDNDDDHSVTSSDSGAELDTVTEHLGGLTVKEDTSSNNDNGATTPNDDDADKTSNEKASTEEEQAER